MQVSIIIVYYQKKKKLLSCLSCIRKNPPRGKYEVIMVNNSRDRTLKRQLLKIDKNIIFIQAPRNLGYGAGNNLGSQVARGKYLFVLNPDTQVLPQAINQLVNYLNKHPRTAIVAPNLVNSRGEIFSQLGTRELTPLRGIVALSFINKVFPTNPISKTYWLDDVPKNLLREVDVVPGSAFMIRREVFRKVQGFDENFFLYFEESDLCRRVKSLGYKIAILPQSQVTHYWQPQRPGTKKSRQYFAQSRFYYFRKHYSMASALLVEIFTRLNKEMVIKALLFLIFFVLISLVWKNWT